MFNYIYNSSLITKIIPTLPRLLEKSLIDCETLLDLGCGPSSPIGKINHNAFTTGVDGFEPYIDEARSNATHNGYYCGI